MLSRRQFWTFGLALLIPLAVVLVGLVGWWWVGEPEPLAAPTSVVVAERASAVTACPPPDAFTLELDDGRRLWCGRVVDGEYACTPSP